MYNKFAGEEVEYDPIFLLYLQTKLINTHYKPEIEAQCTLINFIATERGLEDQLIAKVIEIERKYLEEKARNLTNAAVKYQMQATEGAMIYFLLTKLCSIDHINQYSLESFITKINSKSRKKRRSL